MLDESSAYRVEGGKVEDFRMSFQFEAIASITESTVRFVFRFELRAALRSIGSRLSVPDRRGVWPELFGSSVGIFVPG